MEFKIIEEKEELNANQKILVALIDLEHECELEAKEHLGVNNNLYMGWMDIYSIVFNARNKVRNKIRDMQKYNQPPRPKSVEGDIE